MSTREGYPLHLWAEAEQLVSETLERIGYSIVPPGAGKLVNLSGHPVEKGTVGIGAPGAGIGEAHDKKSGEAGKIVRRDAAIHGVLLSVPSAFAGTISLTFGGEAA